MVMPLLLLHPLILLGTTVRPNPAGKGAADKAVLCWRPEDEYNLLETAEPISPRFIERFPECVGRDVCWILSEKDRKGKGKTTTDNQQKGIKMA